jgi:ribosomal protein S18 acetylase RimI-like enzyme
MLVRVTAGAMQIRPVRPDEYARLGAITVDAYGRLDGSPNEPDYDLELADVGRRAELPGVTVFAAVDDDGQLLGGITYVHDVDAELAEHDDPDAASIRMLAVDPDVQGRGVGVALVRHCIDMARAAGFTAVVLHSGVWMQAAHRMYERLGFVRDPDRDWEPVPGVHLRYYRLDL